MVLIDVDDALVGNVGSDYLLWVLKMKHLQQHQPIHYLLGHSFLSSDRNLLYLVRISGVQLLLFLLPSSRDVHRVEENLPHRQGLLVDGRELIIHFIISSYIKNRSRFTIALSGWFIINLALLKKTILQATDIYTGGN